MISESLVKSAVAGKDGFTWWVGQVVHHEHWRDINNALLLEQKMSQRAKVRIVGYHPFDDTIPANELPWAHVMMSPESGSGQSKLGNTINLTGGETCIGFFLDGDEAQQPVIMGLLHRHDMVRSESSSEAFAPFNGHSGGEAKATKRSAVSTSSIKKPQSPAEQGKVLETDHWKDIEPSNLSVFKSLTGGQVTRLQNALSNPVATNETVEGVTINPKNQTKLLSQLRNYQLGKEDLRLLNQLDPDDPNNPNREGVGGKKGGKDSNGVANNNGGPSAGMQQAETEADVTFEPPSTCGDGGISQMSNIVQDFIGFTNGLESSVGSFVDPVLNKIVNMDAELKRTAAGISSVLSKTITNVRTGLVSKALKSFRKFAKDQLKLDPKNLFGSGRVLKATNSVTGLIFCVFDKIGNAANEFIFNMLKTLIGKVVNGPACAAEQFVSGLLSKVMGLIENLTGPIMSGISWLTGGLQNIKNVLGNASSLFKKISNFLNSCDITPCDKPKRWKASTGILGANKAKSFQKALDQVDVFKGIQKTIGNVNSYLDEGQLAKSIAGGDLSDIATTTVEQSKLVDLLKTTDQLTGGNAAGMVNNGLGSIESAIATSTLFGNSNSVFNACDKKRDNPQNQDDIIPMPPGFTYERCIPPKVEISGEGSDAVLEPIVDSDGRIFSIEVVDGGSGYTFEVGLSIIDNTNHGSGASAEAVVEDGVITSVIVLSGGIGYCGTKSPVGIVTSVHPVRPGLGYTSGDSVTISDPVTGVSTNAPVVITPNGSIVAINTPNNFNHEFTSVANLKINTNSGYGANFVPVMKDIELSITDSAVRPLIGIATVIDCPTEDHRSTT